MFKGKKIAVYITGGIAVFKAVSFVRLLIKAGAEVRVSMTDSACQFVTPLTFQILTKHEVSIDTFTENHPEQVNHIHLADWSDLAIAVPATANTIAKIAHGIADNFVCSALLATTCPKVVVPAMNEHMYHNPATQRNLSQLQEDGWFIVEPVTGFLAEGYEGKGRLPEPEEIFETIQSWMKKNEVGDFLSNTSILITAGGTKERIDPVRYISNDSSGKMGYALAKSAAILGANVTLISTNKHLPVFKGINVHYVETANEMKELVSTLRSTQDIIVMAAAVSDFRVAHPSHQKIKKQPDQESMTIVLEKNPDILAYLGEHKSENQIIIGFAAETNDVLENAKAKLIRKKADYIIANDVSDQTIGFNQDKNKVTILTKEGETFSLPKLDKTQLGFVVWKTIVSNQNK